MEVEDCIDHVSRGNEDNEYNMKFIQFRNDMNPSFPVSLPDILRS